MTTKHELEQKARRILIRRMFSLESRGADSLGNEIGLDALIEILLDNFIECFGKNYPRFRIAASTRDDASLGPLFSGALEQAAILYVDKFPSAKQALTEIIAELES